MVKLREMILGSLVLICMSCDSIYEAPEVVYLIKAGTHYSNVQGSLPGNGFRSLKSDRLEFTARFDESAVYDLKGNEQDDINKLFGFSDCNSSHQNNSARFGWSYNLTSKEIDIYAYTYVLGTREINHLGSARINETNTYQISLVGEEFRFEFKGVVQNIPRGGACDIGLYYLLYPYFGGNQKAPHDIKIFIKEL
ncbi:MAG: hypothetical protein ACI8Q1_001429 [Parvicella sp.]|jgi:hypothetical protein